MPRPTKAPHPDHDQRSEQVEPGDRQMRCPQLATLLRVELGRGQGPVDAPPATQPGRHHPGLVAQVIADVVDRAVAGDPRIDARVGVVEATGRVEELQPVL